MATRLQRVRYDGHLWTVDPRLREFRRVYSKKGPSGGQPVMQVLPFRSEEGDRLLARLIRQNKISVERLDF